MDTFIKSFVANQVRSLKKRKPENLLKILSAIEYTEAILEITASKLFGEKFKWLIVFLTHLTKCIIRLQLLIFHKLGIKTLPSLFTMKSFLSNKPNDTNGTSESIGVENNESNYFKLKASGRTIRTIKNSPTNVEDRDWILPNEAQTSISSTPKKVTTFSTKDIDFDPTKDKMRYIAEILHIIRPICHLSCLFMFKSKSWIQFGVPFTMDSLSLFLMNGTKDMSESQKKEMRRRSILFLHYLIRSPLYDNFSSSIITLILCQIEQNIAGMKYLTSKKILLTFAFENLFMAICKPFKNQ